MRNLKLVVFDFDGTIANTMHLGLEIANDLAGKYDYRQVNREELINYRNMSTRDALRSVGITYLKLPFIVMDFRRELHKRIEQLKPFDGMTGVISQLHTRKFKVGIVTSNSMANVESFLGRTSLQNKIEFVRTQKGLFRKNKLLKSVLKGQKLKATEVLYVGDETRDIEAARKCGIPVASVCWGFNTKAALEQHDPDHLVESPGGLLDLIKHDLPYDPFMSSSVLLQA